MLKSSRDYEDFLIFFQILRLDEDIIYGTFNDLCENVINDDFDIRSSSNNIILKGEFPKIESKNKKPLILLIDEVDVFFNENFFGKTFIPSTVLKSKEITELFDYLWKTYKNKEIIIEDVLNSEKFKNCLKNFKKGKN
jgi:hypothetical protein